MKKWMKGLTVAGVMMLCAGTGITALAGAVGDVNLSSYRVLNPIRNTAERIFQKSGLQRNYSDNDYDDDNDYDNNDHDYDDNDNDNDDNDYDDNDYDNDDYDKNYNNNYEFSYEDRMNYAISSQKNMTLVATYENISSLNLNVANGTFKIVENPELNNKIVIYQKEKEFSRIRHNLSANSSKLSIEYDSDYRKKYTAGYYEEGIIEIPAGFHFNEVDIDAAASVVLVPYIRADRLSLDSEVSEIEVLSFIVGNLKAEVQAGKLKALGEVTGNFEADAEAGQIELLLAGKEEDFNYELDASMGEINIGSSSNSGLVFEKQISHGASKNAKLSSEMGQVFVDFVKKKSATE